MNRIFVFLLSILLLSSLMACDEQPTKNESVEIESTAVENTPTEHHYPEHPVATKITGNVYSIFSNYYSSLVVIGDKGVLISDPAGTYRAQILKEEIAKLTDLPVTHIVLSHEHYDHVDGTEVFEGAEIIAQEKALSIFELDVTNMAPNKVDIAFENFHTIMMGKTRVEVIHYGFPSDGFSNSIIWLPNEKIVYTADLYEDHELQDKAFIESLNSLGVRKALNKVVELKPDFAIASHSIKMTPEALQLGADFFNDLYDAVYSPLMEARKAGYEVEGKFKAEFPHRLKMEKYKNFKNYDHLYRHVQRMIESILHGG